MYPACQPRTRVAIIAAMSDSTGVVVEVHGMLATVLVDGARVRCRPPRDRTTPVIGDRVTVDHGEDPPRITSIGPRERTYQRLSVSGPTPVATHIERLVIVTSAFPGPRLGLIDRMWIALDDPAVQVVLVLNKCELPSAADSVKDLDDFVALGAEVIQTSTKAPLGLELLGERLSHGLSVLAGHSGVGKSSLLNALVPGARVKVGDVHDPTGKGRHTTTVATVHPYRDGLLVDTPGVRAFALDGLSLEGLAERFPGFREPSERCHFAGCLHDGEEGCAVVDEAPPERVQRWLALLASVREERVAARAPADKPARRPR